MNMATDNDPADSEHDADRQARAMNDELRKDVKVWSAARSGSSSREAADLAVPPPTSSPSVKRVRKVKPPIETTPASTSGKPFSMSYDGVTTTQHIAELLARGAR